MFNDYPDIISIETLMKMLQIGKSTAYSLLRNKFIRHVRVGKKYIIPKQCIL